MRSSGQDAELRDVHRSCPWCYFEGSVEAVVDPEGGVVTEVWECPGCGAEFVKEFERHEPEFEREIDE